MKPDRFGTKHRPLHAYTWRFLIRDESLVVYCDLIDCHWKTIHCDKVGYGFAFGLQFQQATPLNKPARPSNHTQVGRAASLYCTNICSSVSIHGPDRLANLECLADSRALAPASRHSRVLWESGCWLVIEMGKSQRMLAADSMIYGGTVHTD